MGILGLRLIVDGVHSHHRTMDHQDVEIIYYIIWYCLYCDHDTFYEAGHGLEVVKYGFVHYNVELLYITNDSNYVSWDLHGSIAGNYIQWVRDSSNMYYTAARGYMENNFRNYFYTIWHCVDFMEQRDEYYRFWGMYWFNLNLHYNDGTSLVLKGGAGDCNGHNNNIYRN